MHCVKTNDDIKRLGTILGVWAHPDDETFSSAGIMAVAINNGQTVACITATRGEAGVQDESRWPASQLADIRTRELEEAYAILGITNHHWLDYADDNCAEENWIIATARIAGIIDHYQPDSILTFGPDGMTGHPDHCTVSSWVDLAVEKSGSRAVIYHAVQTQEQYDAIREADEHFNIFYNIDEPPICHPESCGIHFTLDDVLYVQKMAAQAAMKSQQEGMLEIFGPSLRVSLGTEAFQKSNQA